MSGQLESKVILVTGGSTGIGKASCELFCEEGARVIFVGRREEAGALAEAELKKKGYDAKFIPCDISQRAQVEKLFESIMNDYGRLDGAFNCGGVDGRKAMLLDCTDEDWNEIIGINLYGTFLLVQQELAIMLEQGAGSIVNMSSICGTLARPGRVAYNTSRHGVEAITKTAALEYSSKGIRINAVAPASVRTDIFLRSTGGDKAREEAYGKGHPIGRIAEPREVAKAALWLLGDAPDFIEGHVLTIDGAFTIQ